MRTILNVTYWWHKIARRKLKKESFRLRLQYEPKGEPINYPLAANWPTAVAGTSATATVAEVPEAVDQIVTWCSQDRRVK